MANKIRANRIDARVGANVRQIRSMRGMSQEGLGSRLGVTFQQIQKYEHGTNRISASRLVMIAEALECDLTILFDGVAAIRSSEFHPTLSMRAIRLATIYDRLEDDKVREALFKLVLSMTRGRGEEVAD